MRISMMGLMNQNMKLTIQMVTINDLFIYPPVINSLYWSFNCFWWFPAENNPNFDYPDEESEDEEKELDSEASGNESEQDECASDRSSEPKDLEQYGFSEDDLSLDDDDDDDNDNDEDWMWTSAFVYTMTWTILLCGYCFWTSTHQLSDVKLEWVVRSVMMWIWTPLAFYAFNIADGSSSRIAIRPWKTFLSL